MNVEIREVTEQEREWMRVFLIQHWGSTQMVYSQGIHQCDELPAYAAFMENKPVGLITYQLSAQGCEIVSLDSLAEGKGIGTALIEAVEETALSNQSNRIWLITTNDNLHALRFYQKRGYHLVSIHRNAVEAARRIKPQIPLVGNDGIPIRDEIELEKVFEFAYHGDLQ
ncbi:GNAT family N-acetyltransferase [Brevibacillus ginsengisoli]|uniref:GNAT family N-acetyltransferase n=1 Tax=Brevibacillus ginsengisoli TaxID=363854 RepID=UPI003CF2951A